VNDTGAARVEWVDGPRYWWAVRWSPGSVFAVAFGSLLAYIILFARRALLSLTVLAVFDGSFFAILGAGIVLLYWVPSLRRMGISPDGLIMDVGRRQVGYHWNEVHPVVRTRATGPGAQSTVPAIETRVADGKGFRKNYFVLSSEQGDRLARYLKLA